MREYDCDCHFVALMSSLIMDNQGSSEKDRRYHEASYELTLQRPAPVLSSSSALSPQIFGSTSGVFPLNHNNNRWIHTQQQYPPLPVHPRPSAECFQLSAHPGSSFEPSGSHTNHHLSNQDYGSRAPPLPPHHSSSGYGFTHFTAQHPNSSYAPYPSPYGTRNGNRFHPAVRPTPGANMWTMPRPTPPPRPIPLVFDITPSDVLCGRGGATNSHSGNRAFRSFVKDYQDRYLKAKKRDKPAVASVIVDLVRQKGGRFLRRYERPAPNGQVLWVDIGDDRAREKTCQALRENAPELRRRKQRIRKEKTKVGPSYSTASSCSFSDEDGDENEHEDKTQRASPRWANEKFLTTETPACVRPKVPGSSSPSEYNGSSNATSSATNGASPFNAETGRGQQLVTGLGTPTSQSAKYPERYNMEHPKESSEQACSLSHSSTSAPSVVSSDCGSILIRPISMLLPKRLWRATPIPVDQLEQGDRDNYLRDFYPPCPTSAQNNSRTSNNGKDTVLKANYYHDNNVEGAATSTQAHPTPSTTISPAAQAIEVVGV